MGSSVSYQCLQKKKNSHHHNYHFHNEQGRIHGRTVADSWAGAVMRKPLRNQKCDGPTDVARCKVACPRLKKVNMCILEEKEGEEGEKEKEEEEEEEREEEKEKEKE